MRCKIADLVVEIPEAGGMPPRCQAYLTDQTGAADIVIDARKYALDKWGVDDYDSACYLESGGFFYGHLLRFDGLMLHASAVEYKGKAYLFSGPCTVGKSTHTRLWQQTFGDAAQVFNDDKPALRFVDGRWYAYGTPWCGKDGINQNKKVPVAGICFLKQGTDNEIRRMSSEEAISHIYSQTTYILHKPENMELLLQHIGRLICHIPIWELKNVPSQEAVWLSYQTMSAAENDKIP